MKLKRLWAKLPFENRLIRFLIFDLLLGFELSGMDMSDGLAMVNGFVALYLLITSILGRCPLQQAIVMALEMQGILEEKQ